MRTWLPPVTNTHADVMHQVPMAMRAQSVRLLSVLYVSDGKATTARSTHPAGVQNLGFRVLGLQFFCGV